MKIDPVNIKRGGMDFFLLTFISPKKFTMEINYKFKRAGLIGKIGDY
jgi:hypothetical protein